jgi:hypothetical protein
MYMNTWISAISAVGEWAIAIVILWEWEGSRVDHFMEDVGTGESTRGRTKIFCEYLKIPEDARPRNELFKEELEKPENRELRETCAESIRCLSRIGARMPWIWPLKNIVLNWHVAVFLCEILGAYVRQKRNEVGTSYATSFLRYALASLERPLKQKGGPWTIRDTALPGKVVVLTRDHMEQMKRELKGILDA